MSLLLYKIRKLTPGERKKAKKIAITVILCIVIAVAFALLIGNVALADDNTSNNYPTLTENIVDSLYCLYGDGFAENLGDVIVAVMEATAKALETDVGTVAFSLFSGIAASLVVLYFFLDLMDQVTREMMSFEKFVMMMIKMLICVVIVLSAQELCTLMLKLGQNLLLWIQENFNGMNEDSLVRFYIESPTKNSDGSYSGGVLAEDEDAFLEAFAANTGIGKGQNGKFFQTVKMMFTHPWWTMESLIVSLVVAVLRIILYFMVLSNGIVFLVRFFFAPIGVVNLYRGEQSQGMHYFKSLLAAALIFAVQYVMLIMASRLGTNLLLHTDLKFFGFESRPLISPGGTTYGYDNTFNICADDSATISDALNFKRVVLALIPQLAAIGGMSGAGRIVNDVVGVR